MYAPVMPAWSLDEYEYGATAGPCGIPPWMAVTRSARVGFLPAFSIAWTNV